jgi:hypothetical protein
MGADLGPVIERSSAFDVRTRLRHFAIVSVGVDADALRRHVHPRFEIETVADASGRAHALVSVVPFQDIDFTFVRVPWLRWTFGQTNYRAYVRDGATGERAVWFFGTALDFAGIVVPRYGWRLPWHRASIAFDCDYDESARRYRRYRMSATSSWASAVLELEDTGKAPVALPGFPDLESGLIALTHPLTGFYYRRDGRLGSYCVSHPRLEPTVGRIVEARFPLLERLGLTSGDVAAAGHSVLIQHETTFTIHLPPAIVPL